MSGKPHPGGVLVRCLNHYDDVEVPYPLEKAHFAFLTYYSLDQCSNCFTAATTTICLSVYLILLPSLINKTPRYFSSSIWGLDPEWAPFLPEDHGFRHVAAHPAIYHIIQKNKNKTEMRFWVHQMWKPSATWFCLEILSIKIMNKMFKRYSVSCICYWCAISLQLTSLKLAIPFNLFVISWWLW